MEFSSSTSCFLKILKEKKFIDKAIKHNIKYRNMIEKNLKKWDF